MPRFYSAPSLVSLPRLSAAHAVVLGTQLVTEGRARAGLTPSLARALDRVEGSLGALRRARELTLGRAPADTGETFRADVRLDAGWSGFYSFLVGWAKMPAPGKAAAQAERARRLLAIVFPDGLAFTQLPFRAEWAESQMRLDRLAQPENAELVGRLGAGAIVEEIGEAFDAYGRALQVTARRAEVKASVSVRASLEALVAEMRKYVLSVSAYGAEHEDDAEARALVEALLAPLVAWKAGGRRRAEAPAGPPPAPSGAGPAPSIGHALGPPCAGPTPSVRHALGPPCAGPTPSVGHALGPSGAGPAPSIGHAIEPHAELHGPVVGLDLGIPGEVARPLDRDAVPARLDGEAVAGDDGEGADLAVVDGDDGVGGRALHANVRGRGPVVGLAGRQRGQGGEGPGAGGAGRDSAGREGASERTKPGERGAGERAGPSGRGAGERAGPGERGAGSFAGAAGRAGGGARAHSHSMVAGGFDEMS
ncbi:MAG TPA: hypothetical protein VFS43_47040 [Polyangiaceae bacterium]|nr:hypothetical protein [Polyangiaceae bacterium]